MDEVTSQRDVILGRVGLVIIWLVIWEVVGQTNTFLLSAPTLVVATFFGMIASGEIFRLLEASGKIFLISWVISMVVGIAIGIAVGWIRPVRLMLEPFLNALYSTPLVALIPLMILWFGLGLNAMVVSVVLNGIFPIIIMTIIGVSNAGKDYLEVAKSFRLGQAATLAKVVLPGALPYLLVGLRLTTASVLRGTIFAGFLIPDNGIGNALRSAGEAFNTNRLYGLIIFVVAAAILVDVALRRGISLVDYTRS